MTPQPPPHRHLHTGRVAASRATALLQGQTPPPFTHNPYISPPGNPQAPQAARAPHTHPARPQTSSVPRSGCLGRQPGCGSPESNLGEGTAVSLGSAVTGASREERQLWMAVTTLLHSWWARGSVSGQPRPHPRAAPRPPRAAGTPYESGELTGLPGTA